MTTPAPFRVDVLLKNGRIPLDAGLKLAMSLAEALEAREAQGAVGPFDTTTISLDAQGAVSITPSSRAEAFAPELVPQGMPDVLSDVYSLGAVYYRVFAGLSHLEAERREGGKLLSPSRFNPSIDDSLDALIMALLANDPVERPYQLSQIRAVLAGICSEMGLDEGRESLVDWIFNASERPDEVTQVGFMPALASAPQTEEVTDLERSAPAIPKGAATDFTRIGLPPEEKDEVTQIGAPFSSVLITPQPAQPVPVVTQPSVVVAPQIATETGRPVPPSASSTTGSTAVTWPQFRALAPVAPPAQPVMPISIPSIPPVTLEQVPPATMTPAMMAPPVVAAPIVAQRAAAAPPMLAPSTIAPGPFASPGPLASMHQGSPMFVHAVPQAVAEPASIASAVQQLAEALPPAMAMSMLPMHQRPPMMGMVAAAPAATHTSRSSMTRPAPARAGLRLPPVRWQVESDDEDLDAGEAEAASSWQGPVRFDRWAAASAVVVALGVVLIVLL